jgi:hypothetical protein
MLLFETLPSPLETTFGPLFVATITDFPGADTITGPTDLPDGFILPSLEATITLNPASPIPEPSLGLLTIGLILLVRRRGR